MDFTVMIMNYYHYVIYIHMNYYLLPQFLECGMIGKACLG